MTKARVTAILLTYRRSENIQHILDALRSQHEPVELMLVNNGGFQTHGIERVACIPFNAGPWIRYPFALAAETPYVMFIDDDLLFKDADLVGDMLAACEKRKDGITGIFGKRLAGGPKWYSESPDASGWVHIVKGRCMLMERCAMERVTFGNITKPRPTFHEDLYLSLEIGRGEAIHWVEPGWHKRVSNLPDPGAQADMPTHYPERDAMIAWHLEKIHLDDVLYRSEMMPHLCTRGELRHLWRCATKAPEGLPMVELGAFKGASAVVLADAAYKQGSTLTLVDTFVYGTVETGANSPGELASNLERARVPVMPRIVSGDSRKIPDGIDQVGFLHIDTDHHREHLFAELAAWEPLMADGGVIAFHDYCENSPEMIPAIDDWLKAHPEWKRIGLERWMLGIQKVGGDA